MSSMGEEIQDLQCKVQRIEEALFIGAGKPSVIERMTKVEARLASLDLSINRLTSAVNKVTMAVILAVVGALLKMVLVQ